MISRATPRAPGARRQALLPGAVRPARLLGWAQRALAPLLILSLALPWLPAGTAQAQTTPPATPAGATSAPGSTEGAATPALPTPVPAAPAQTQQRSAEQSVGQDLGRTKAFEELTPEDLFGQPIYANVKAEWDKQGFQPVPAGTEIKIPAPSYSATDGLAGLQVQESFQGKAGPTLLWTVDDGWVEWDIDVPVSGFYEITVDYYPIPGKRASVQRDLLIDGTLPFREAKRVVFQRVWKDSFWPPKRDNNNQDVRPPQIEVPQWESKTIVDADGRYDEPFQIALTK